MNKDQVKGERNFALYLNVDIWLNKNMTDENAEIYIEK